MLRRKTLLFLNVHLPSALRLIAGMACVDRQSLQKLISDRNGKRLSTRRRQGYAGLPIEGVQRHGQKQCVCTQAQYEPCSQALHLLRARRCRLEFQPRNSACRHPGAACLVRQFIRLDDCPSSSARVQRLLIDRAGYLPAAANVVIHRDPRCEMPDRPFCATNRAHATNSPQGAK